MSIEYYKRNYEKIYSAVENAQWRVWKAVNGEIVRQCPYILTSPKRLLKFIREVGNVDCLYVSTSTWLNPHKTHGLFFNQEEWYGYPRAGYLIADNILIDSYFFIDFDSEFDLEIAYNDARTCYKKLQNEPKLKFLYVQFSGTKGFHLVYKHKKVRIEDPIKRINYYRNEKKRIVNSLPKLATIDEHHKSIIQDITRVYSVPYSIKKNGNIVQPIDLNTFVTGGYLNALHSLGIEATKADEGIVAPGDSQGLHRYQYRDEKGHPLTSRSTYYSIANFVPGLKNNYVPFIKLHRKKLPKIELDYLSKVLSSYIIFYDEPYIWIVGTKLFQKDRLLKIMKKLRASNCHELKRRYNLFRVTDSKGFEGKPVPLRLKTINENLKYTYSRAHCNFFKIGIDESLLRGNEDLKTYKCEAG